LLDRAALIQGSTMVRHITLLPAGAICMSLIFKRKFWASCRRSRPVDTAFSCGSSSFATIYDEIPVHLFVVEPVRGVATPREVAKEQKMRRIVLAVALAFALTGTVVAVAAISTAEPAAAGCTDRC
jgi:hypothetical protein